MIRFKDMAIILRSGSNVCHTRTRTISKVRKKMADAVFNADEVAARVKKLRAHWLAAQADAKTWKGAHALVVVHGKRNMTNPNAKPLLFQRYLLTIGASSTLLF